MPWIRNNVETDQPCIYCFSVLSGLEMIRRNDDKHGKDSLGGNHNPVT